MSVSCQLSVLCRQALQLEAALTVIGLSAAAAVLVGRSLDRSLDASMGLCTYLSSTDIKGDI